jgi:hypothetical protein
MESLLKKVCVMRGGIVYLSAVSDDEFGEKSVSVLLDGEESEMVFIDHPSSEMSVSPFVP